MPNKKFVKLIIATTNNSQIFFNYGDDYADITRILVEDHTPWEEVDAHDIEKLYIFRII